MLEKKLEKIGLSEKEAKVYVAALELGKGSATEIAKKSGINRATTYFTLENLMKKGLLSASSVKKKQIFVAENPEQIESIIIDKQRELEQQREEVKSLVEELKEISSPDLKKPVVKYYLGKKSIIRMASDSFDEVKNETMWVAFSKDKLDLFLSDNENNLLRKKREKRKIKVTALYNSKEEILSNDDNLRIKIDNDKYHFPGDVAVYKDKIRLTSYDDEIGIIIENKNIAETLKSIFKMAVNCAKKTKKGSR